jgi:hypothetical protein
VTAISEPGWNWGPAWTRLRSDVNTLIWLFEEERTIQRLYLESAFWALTGTRFTVDEFAREVGAYPAPEGPTDEHERSAQGALDSGSAGQVRQRSNSSCCCAQSETATP